NEELGVAANQLHLIFVPLMTCYGLAYLLVQWNRLNIGVPFARTGFLVLIYLLCAAPMILGTWLAVPRAIRWPPYVPPAISVLHEWLGPGKITGFYNPGGIGVVGGRPRFLVTESAKVFCRDLRLQPSRDADQRALSHPDQRHRKQVS